jgi:hypothetical protein
MTTPAEAQTGIAAPTKLLAIFWLFFQIGVMSFGGGISAWLYRSPEAPPTPWPPWRWDSAVTSS